MASYSQVGDLPDRIGAITAVANDTCYFGNDKGEVFAQVIATGAITKTGGLGIIPEPISAICTTATVNYIGTKKGNIYTQTIAGGAIVFLINIKDEEITGMEWDATGGVIWVSTAKGNIYSVTP